MERREELARKLVQKLWQPVGELEEQLAALLSREELAAVIAKIKGEKRKLEEEALLLLSETATLEEIEGQLKSFVDTVVAKLAEMSVLTLGRKRTKPSSSLKYMVNDVQALLPSSSTRGAYARLKPLRVPRRARGGVCSKWLKR